MPWDREVDLVAVGSGLGGLAAAIAGHDAGGEVLVVEKAPKLGGVCAYSGGELFVPGNHLGGPDDPAACRAYLDFLAGGFARPEHRDVLLEEGPAAVRWSEAAAGARWRVIDGFPDYHHPFAPGTRGGGRTLEPELFEGASLGPWQRRTYGTPHMPPGITHEELFAWGGLAAMPRWDFRTLGTRVAADVRGMGPAMMGPFVKAAMVDRGIEAWTGSPLVALVREGDRVSGAVVRRPDGLTRVRVRRGVVLAMGGYDWNPSFARSFEGLPEWRSMVQPSVEGDHIVCAGELGAALAGVPPYNLGMFFGYRVPGETHDGAPLWRASWEGGHPHAIWVNRAGQRFADESFYRDYLPKVRTWDGVRQEQPNYPPFLIFSQDYRDRYAFCSYMPGQPVPESLLARADTLAGLAERLGIDPDGLEATVSRFNEGAEIGEDPDFGRGRYPWAAIMTGDRDRPHPNLGPLARPPFYGLALTPVGVGVNAVGLATDTRARVLSLRGGPIAGLYAAGNSAALLDIGAGYQSGLSNLRGLTWGRIAGADAMGA